MKRLNFQFTSTLAVIGMITFAFPSFGQDPKSGLDIQIIPPQKVVSFISGRFQTDIVQQLLREKNNPIHDLINELAKLPLLVYEPSNHPMARYNNSNYFHLLALREKRYEDPMMADLYLLHEIFHITSMYYGKPKSYQSWSAKLIQNEKDASFFNEIWIFFLYPEIRERFHMEEIWVDRFLKDEVRLNPKMSNWEYFRADPKSFEAKLRKAFVSIGLKMPKGMDTIERRTWRYDFGNEVFADAYWKYAPEIESKMMAFIEESKTNPKDAAESLRDWIYKNSKDGLVFDQPNLEFHINKRGLIRLDQNPSIDRLPELLEQSVSRMQTLMDKGSIGSGVSTQNSKELLKFGISTTVYSVPFFESQEVTEETWGRTDYREIYGEPFTQKQDPAHGEFIEAFRKWSSPVLNGLDGFPFAYPGNGSSDGIKDTLARLKAQNPNVTIHIFEGEYEGVPAYAEGLGIKLVKHPRTKETIENLASLTKPGEVFYLSQPSGLDGNLWKDYDLFMKKTNTVGMKVLVDLAYVGTVIRDYKIDLSYPNIETIFFSLSKSFGVFYQRIGGVFSRKPNPLLHGSIWFKNLLNLRIGTELLRRYSVHRLPRLYRWAQTIALRSLKEETGIDLIPSDVVLIGHRKVSKSKVNGLESKLYRGGEKEGFVRACLTPSMTLLIEGQKKASPPKSLGGCEGALLPQ